MFKKKYRNEILDAAWTVLAECNPSAGQKRRLRRTIDDRQRPDELVHRAELKVLLAKYQKDGLVAVYRWGRDCDQCESDDAELVPATVMAFTRVERRAYEYAEGPTTVSLMSFEDYDQFVPSFRDRRAEQYNY